MPETQSELNKKMELYSERHDVSKNVLSLFKLFFEEVHWPQTEKKRTVLQTPPRKVV